MKILVCGKGGCGKSTIVALLAKEMALRKNKVLVIDNDESNIGIHSRLGMQKPEDFMNYFGGKKVLFEKTKELKDKWGLDDLPGDYLSEKGSIWLLSMGKIYDFGEGCACPINALSSKFLEMLDLGDKEFLIADTDAGIEHFGRGVERGVDMLLVVIDPSRESIFLAQKICELGQQANKPVYYVLNRIADKGTEEFLLNSVDRERVIATIPDNKKIFLSGLAGSELDVDVEDIKGIADMLESKERRVPEMTENISEKEVHQAIGQVMHPAISRTLVELGMVKDINVEHGKVALTLVLPILGIPASIKDFLANSLRQVVVGLGLEAEIRIAEMNQKERQAFLAMEQESWKGLP